MIVGLPPEVEQETVDAIAAETRRAHAKHGDNDHNHHDAVWAAIAGEEYGEVCEAALDELFGKAKDHEHLDEELIHLATVIVRWVQVRRARRV